MTGKPFFKITGFELKESNAPYGIHLIGCIDFSGESYSTYMKVNVRSLEHIKILKRFILVRAFMVVLAAVLLKIS